MKTHAQVVVIGGGIVGCSILYHLTKMGWSDVMLLERSELTSGSTWHAAGLIPNFIGDLNMAKVHQEAISLYPKIEEETGLSSGWHGCGAIRFAKHNTGCAAYMNHLSRAFPHGVNVGSAKKDSTCTEPCG